ncbi:hypothetical protein BV898_14553 [Hypsibius exemplaris]|uniref:Uncharacterized protein n=1 Tax=Hypsibius exemplaris TaxID=2072580 RepID=A0A9X6N954_HYPEX|nr:hypothetical protein BV898_14553 [Hypsibius exemplaris]
MEPFILPPLEMEMPPALESPSRMMRSSQDKSLRSSQDKSPLSFTGYDGTTDEEEPHSFNSSVASSSDDRLPPVMISRENVITLVDSSGREFHTNLRASDLEYLVKYSIRSNLRRDMRMQKAARTDVFPGRSAYGTNGNGEGHSHYTTQTTLSTNQYGGPAKRTANQVYNNLSSKETFDLLGYR